MIDPDVAKQVIAFFSIKNGRNPIGRVKLMKLVYLADRESMRATGHPITYDSFACLENGPIPSSIYNLVKGDHVKAREGDWSEWVEAPLGVGVKLIKQVELTDLDELSQENLDVLEEVWGQFGRMNEKRIIDYTHDLPEYTDPGQGTSTPLSYEAVFRGLGVPDEQAQSLGQDISALR